MQLKQFLLKIRQFFNPSEAQQILAALRQDSLIWELFLDEQFREPFVAFAQGDAQVWHPVNAAFFSLNSSPEFLALARDPKVDLPESLKQMALQQVEEVRQSAQPSISLRSAVLTALGLREHFRIAGNWDAVISHIFSSEGPALPDKWKTVFSCLSGSVNDWPAVQEALIRKTPVPFYVKTISHVILTFPAAQSEQVKRFVDFLAPLSFEVQAANAREVLERGEPLLAGQIARQLVEPVDPESYLSPTLEAKTPDEVFSTANDTRHLSYLYQIAGNEEVSHQLLEKSEQFLRYWQIGQEICRIERSLPDLTEEDANALLSRSFPEIPENELLLEELILVSENYLAGKAWADRAPEDSPSAWVQFSKARRFMEAEDTERAVETARRALCQILEQISTGKNPLERCFIKQWDPMEKIVFLQALGLKDEALKLAEALLTIRPNDLSLLEKVGELAGDQKGAERALELAQVETLLSPDDIGRHRKLARLFELNEDWENAYFAWSDILRLSETPLEPDRVAFAQSAFAVEKYDEVIETCDRVLSANQNNGFANLLMGKAMMEKGESAPAIPYLSNAIVLVPEDPSGWMLLAKAYQTEEQPKRAQETLQTAILTAPDSADINYALGESYRQTGSLSEALPYLKKAATLNPGLLSVSLDLADTLKSLGYLKEAEVFIREARKKWPRNTELAYLEAETLLASGRDESALSALEVSVSQENPPAARLMVYVKTLLQHKNPLLAYYPTLERARLAKAQSALEKLVKQNPAELQGQIYLAEVAGAYGDLAAAYKLLKHILEIPEANHARWKWRVQGDLGVVAFKLEETETALAALEQAAQQKPELIDLQRFLCDAYARADLTTEALQTARIVLKMAPDDIQNLTWFAAASIRLGKKDEAVNALRCATQLAADQPEYFIQLARLEWQVGDFGATRQTLQMLVALDCVNAGHLQQAAILFHKLGDSRSSLNCLEQAIQLEPQDETSLYIESAYLNQKMGRFEEALKAIQKALESAPRKLFIYVFQSDLLAALHRYDAAVACLEHALKLREESGSEAGPAEDNSRINSDEILPAVWISELEKLSAIHIRFAGLLREQNDLTQALDHSVKALVICPESLELRYFAADVASAMLRMEEAAELAAIPEEHTYFEGDEEKINIAEDLEAWVALVCLRAEIAFNNEEEVLAGRLIQKAILAAPENPRVIAAQCRLLARWGDYEMANEYFVRAVTNYQHETGSLNVEPASRKPVYYNPLKGCYDRWQLWLSEAALELNRWQKAMQFMELYIREMPYEPRATLLLARIYILQAEQKRLCDELNCVNHAPEDSALDETQYEKAKTLLAEAAQLGESSEVARWQLRHEVVFHLTLENVRQMMEANQRPEDLVQIVAALRWIGNNAGAIQIARRASESPDLMLQAAMCYMKEEANEALEIAQKAVASRPHNPMGHAVLAMIAGNRQMWVLALQSIETALSFWPDEPAWHAMAAGYVTHLDDINNLLSHWEQAYELAPGQFEYALALGKVYLELKNYSQAVEVLSKAVQLNSKSADAWYQLACAYQQVGNLMKGMDCADRASSLDGGVVDPLLLSGEIALQLGRLNHALGYAKNALRRDSNNQHAIQFLVAVLKEQGELKKALRVIEKSLPSIEEPSMALLLDRARLVLELEGADAALPLLDELPQVEKDHPEVLRLLAKTQFALGDLASSEQNALLSLQKEPDEPEMNLLLGRIQLQEGNLDRAIHHLSESIRIAPLKIEAYLELAKTYQKRREEAKALQIYQKAIKLSENDHRPYYEAGLILRERKNYVEAEAMLRHASEMAPEDINIRRQLGAIVALNLVHNAQEVRPIL